MSTKGIRYTREQKQEVVDFVTQYNYEHNGRGGVANATKKFGITAMTVKGWVDRFGPPSSSQYNSEAYLNGNIYQKMGRLHDEIVAKENELTSLKEKFEEFKQEADI